MDFRNNFFHRSGNAIVNDLKSLTNWETTFGESSKKKHMLSVRQLSLMAAEEKTN